MAYFIVVFGFWAPVMLPLSPKNMYTVSQGLLTSLEIEPPAIFSEGPCQFSYRSSSQYDG